MVFKFLSVEQKEFLMEICSDLLQRIEDEPDLLKYYRATKRQFIHWKLQSSPTAKEDA
jgi:hypothetical protein